MEFNNTGNLVNYICFSFRHYLYSRLILGFSVVLLLFVMPTRVFIVAFIHAWRKKRNNEYMIVICYWEWLLWVRTQWCKVFWKCSLDQSFFRSGTESSTWLSEATSLMRRNYWSLESEIQESNHLFAGS